MLVSLAPMAPSTFFRWTTNKCKASAVFFTLPCPPLTRLFAFCLVSASKAMVGRKTVVFRERYADDAADFGWAPKFALDSGSARWWWWVGAPPVVMATQSVNHHPPAPTATSPITFIHEYISSGS